MKENCQQIAVSGVIPRGERFSKEAKGVNKCLKVQFKDHIVDFIGFKNINSRANGKSLS